MKVILKINSQEWKKAIRRPHNLFFISIISISVILVFSLSVAKIAHWSWFAGLLLGYVFFLTKMLIYKKVFRLFADEALESPRTAKNYIWMFVVGNFLMNFVLLFLVVYFDQYLNIFSFILAFTIVNIFTILSFLLKK